MIKIGLLSDTHGFLDPALRNHFEICDEIWHAGDIGSWDVIDTLKTWGKPIRAVFGNIDDQSFRREFSETLVFPLEKIKVVMTHIGGAPGKYNAKSRKIIQEEKPDLFVCGHSHILRVMFDQQFNIFYMNPGAAGKHGFHVFRTALRFSIDGNRVTSLEVIELGERGRLDP